MTKDAQDSLNVLSFAAKKVPILPAPDKTKFVKQVKQLSDKETKHLELIMKKAEKEKELPPEISKPKYWNSELEHYEWCFKLIFEHGQKPCSEDKEFMQHFESLPEFEHYRQRFENLKLIYN